MNETAFSDTTGIQKVRRLGYMDIISFLDIMLMVSTIYLYSIPQLIIRPHLTTEYMRPIVTDGVAWSVYLYVCLSQ